MLSPHQLTLTNGQAYYTQSSLGRCAFFHDYAVCKQRFAPYCTPDSAQYYATAFSERSLSLQSDVLNAWTGVEKFLAKQMRTSFFFGLPVQMFEQALLWQHGQRAKRRVGFPSWSWTGWVGAVYWEDDGPLGIKEGPSQRDVFIVWYRKADHHRYRLIWDIKELQAAFEKSPRSLQYLQKFVEARSSGKDCLLERRVDRFPSPGNAKSAQAKKTYPTARRSDLLSSFAQVSGAPPEYPYLHFWTHSATFRLSAHSQTSSNTQSLADGLCSAVLRDNREELCGSILIHEDWMNSRIDELVEVIVLSGARDWDRRDQAFFKAGNLIRYRRTTRTYKWPLWNVMLIRWDDRNVANRVAVGKVYKEAMEHAFTPGTEWKEITLG